MDRDHDRILLSGPPRPRFRAKGVRMRQSNSTYSTRTLSPAWANRNIHLIPRPHTPTIGIDAVAFWKIVRDKIGVFESIGFLTKTPPSRPFNESKARSSGLSLDAICDASGCRLNEAQLCVGPTAYPQCAGNAAVTASRFICHSIVQLSGHALHSTALFFSARRVCLEAVSTLWTDRGTHLFTAESCQRTEGELRQMFFRWIPG